MAIAIDSEFAGGNITVESIDDDVVYLHQDLRDTTRDWFYWCFRVRGVQDRTLRFVFTRSPALGVRGPAVSLDKGETWQWLGSDAVEGNTFSYTFPPDDREVRLSFGMPYQEAHWRRFIQSLNSEETFSLHKLCTTKKGRDVEYLLVGCQEVEPQFRVVITCRHHCCEMMASYALEGLIQWLVDGSSVDAEWLRDSAHLLIVPFMDKDGVEEGDQGKGRHPRDHNRDYQGESLYASTRAIRELLPSWSGGRLRVEIDLHCPSISGDHNEVIYLVGSPYPHIASEQRRFSEILESVARGPLPFRAADFLSFGSAWNTVKNSSGGKGFSRWCSELPDLVLATGLEIPYANARGAEVNQSSARSFGKDLGTALASYLRSL